MPKGPINVQQGAFNFDSQLFVAPTSKSERCSKVKDQPDRSPRRVNFADDSICCHHATEILALLQALCFGNSLSNIVVFLFQLVRISMTEAGLVCKWRNTKISRLSFTVFVLKSNFALVYISSIFSKRRNFADSAQCFFNGLRNYGFVYTCKIHAASSSATKDQIFFQMRKSV